MPEVVVLESVSERRAVKRHANPAELHEIAAVLDGSVFPAYVHDLSPTGASLVVGEPVEADSYAIIELYNRPRHFWYRKPLQVLHVRARPDGTWLVGGAFRRGLSHEQIEELLADEEARAD